MSQSKFPRLDEFMKRGSELAKSLDKAVLISINLRNFKYFNEIYGVKKGDWLILRMIEYFCLDNAKCVLGAKSYIDHIVILCEGADSTQEELMDYYEEYAKVFIDDINMSYPRSKVNVQMGMYILKENEDFLVAKDNARYARRSILNSYDTTLAYFTDELRIKSIEVASVIPNFKNSIENDGIIVMLQPKFSVEQDKIIGAEALARFRNDKGELVSPALFIPVLENANIIYQLDFEVLRQVVEMQKRWLEEGKELFPISVNLSRMDLLEEGFIEELDALIEESKVPKQYIEFELTETVVVENLSVVVNKLNNLRDKGYRIAIDDFGSGYNSLYVLGQIPANVIKFDRGFVLYSIDNVQGRMIMKNLVQTFKNIDFEVLCEGVETHEQRENVVECGCDVIQGFLYDKPLDVIDFEKKYVFKQATA